jgi:hypothetical protein
VSHELRTPLTSIRGFVEALEDGAVAQAGTAERFLGKIRTHADRMAALVEDLLELSRAESGARPPRFEEVSPAELAEDVRVLRLRAIAGRDGVPVDRFRLTPGGVEGFEAASPLAIGLGVTRNATSTSNIAVGLSEGSAIAGEHDLTVRVEMRDGAVPWAQWVQVRVPLAESAGLAPSSRLRFNVSSNEPRILHIGIDSSAYSNRDASGELGWDIELDGSMQPIDLELATATFPDWGEEVPDSIEEILGAPVILGFAESGTLEHPWHGILREMELVHADGHAPLYRAVMVPTLWYATQTVRTRVFLDLKVPEIIELVLKDLGFAPGDHFEASLTATYPKREYVLQYAESDFDFIARIAGTVTFLRVFISLLHVGRRRGANGER